LRKVMLKKVQETKKPIYFTDDRNGRIIANTIYPVFNDDGNVVKAAILGFDITEQKHLEETLQTSEERFKRMFQNSASGMILADPDFRFLQVNDAFCRMLGYTEKDLIGKSFQDVTYEEDKKIGGDLVSELLTGKRDTIELEKRYVHKNGTVLWGLVSASLLRDINNRPLNLVAQVLDITARKQSERELILYRD
jgi:PAS domain S-box-containing protein